MARKANRANRVVTESEPRRVEVAAGNPANVTFVRHGARPGRDIVVFPSLGRLVTLPEHADAVLELPPLPPGQHDFYFSDGTPCGTLVVSQRAKRAMRRWLARLRSRGSGPER